jgi:phage-related protein
LISFVAVGKAIGIVANAWKGFTLLLNSKAFSLIIKALKGIIGFLPTIGRLFLSVGSAIIGVIKAIALAFIHNPILLAIAAVIAILYLLWRNWDTVCAWVKNKWDWLGKAIESGVENIKSFIKGIVDWITNTFTSLWSDAWDNICSIFGDKFSGLRNIVAPIFNWICEKLDYIVAKYNEIKDQNAQTANTSTMSYLNPFGHNAAGTDNWRGGLTYINEDNKGEIVDLPRGTKIYPHDESVAMARREGKGGISVMIPKLADQIIVRQDSDIDRITDALVFKLKGMAINRMEGAV